MRCQVCGFEEAEARCRVCGRFVCRHDADGGICAACSAALCGLCRMRLSISTCVHCGSPVCDACSARRGLARICRRCAP